MKGMMSDEEMETKRDPATNPEWKRSDSHRTPGRDTQESSASDNDLESPRSDFDLHLDDVDVASNDSDDYAKSSDLHRDSNDSASKDSNDATNRYLDDGDEAMKYEVTL